MLSPVSKSLKEGLLGRLGRVFQLAVESFSSRWREAGRPSWRKKNKTRSGNEVGKNIVASLVAEVWLHWKPDAGLASKEESSVADKCRLELQLHYWLCRKNKVLHLCFFSDFSLDPRHHGVVLSIFTIF